jgi:hypothetical protein
MAGRDSASDQVRCQTAIQSAMPPGAARPAVGMVMPESGCAKGRNSFCQVSIQPLSCDSRESCSCQRSRKRCAISSALAGWVMRGV